MSKYLEKYKYTTPDLTDSHTVECGATPEFAMFFQLPRQQRSRLNEDRILYERLFKKWEQFESSGTYVEMGAFDGHTESNSRFFDICLGWNGLLVEGNPSFYAKVLKARPHAHRMSFAPSCSAEYEVPSCSAEYEVENKTIEFYKYPMANSGLIGQALTYQGKPTVDVPCGPLAPVLQDIFENERINFFSLDVEGAEPMILETIDFDKVLIEVMMIEVQNNHCRGNCESRQRVRAKMEKEGYRRYEHVVAASDIYIHPNSRYQLD